MGTAQIEQLHQCGLYDILFRNAGVGFLFYEPPDGFEIESEDRLIGGLNLPMPTDSWKKYLVVHRYYPTLDEAISAEMTRLAIPQEPEGGKDAG